MTSHCANPACSIPLRYLQDGRLFQFEVRPKIVDPPRENQSSSATGRLARKVTHFWLCGKCASTLTLAFDALKGVVVKPRPTS